MCRVLMILIELRLPMFDYAKREAQKEFYIDHIKATSGNSNSKPPGDSAEFT